MSTPTITLHGRKVVGGSAEGEALVTHRDDFRLGRSQPDAGHDHRNAA